MKDILKNWKTTLIGLIALIGLGYNFYKQGGLEVSDFLLLVVGVGFISAKDGDKSHSRKNLDTGIGGGIKNPKPKKDD